MRESNQKGMDELDTEVSVTGIRDAVRKRLGQLWAGYKELLPNQRAYLNGAVFLAISFALKPFTADGSTAALILAAASWGLAMIADLSALYRKVFDTIFGKLIALAVVALLTNLAVAMAAGGVNEMVGIDPARFIHTITFSAALFAIPLVAIGLYFIVLLGMAFLFLYLMFVTLPNEETKLLIYPWYKAGVVPRYRGLTAFAQVGSVIVLSIVAFHWYQNNQKAYWDTVQDWSRSFLYTFEMFEKAPCKLEKGQRVAFLDGDRVLVASKAGEAITFKVTQCVAPVDGM